MRALALIAALSALAAVPLWATAGAVAPSHSVQALSDQEIDTIIGSARADVPARVSVANREVVVLRASIVGRSAADRARTAEQAIADVSAGAAGFDVAWRDLRDAAVVSVNGRDVLVIVPADVNRLLGETVDGAAAAAVSRLQVALDEVLEARQPKVLAWAVAEVVLATILFVLGIWTVAHARRRISSAVAGRTAAKLSRSSMGDEIVRRTHLLDTVRRAVTVALVAILLAATYVWLAFVLRRFPYTRPWGEALRGFLWERVVWMLQGIVAATPGLFTIALIVAITRVATRAVRLVFDAVEEGRLTLPLIYPETADATRKLATAGLWLFALVLSYPYVPGSQSGVFEAVGVFVGIVVSLGSAGLMNHVMSGFTVTYSRALRPGDYVSVNDVEGTVTEIGTLSTKIETLLREEITIPNAVLMSGIVTNFSRHAATKGVYVPAVVTIGYDVPWRQVEAMLLQAASRTAGLRTDPPPIVRQSALEDFFVRYTMFVALETPAQRRPVLAELHANIQDAFNEYGVQIMSPHYENDPEGGVKVVPKSKWFSAPASPARKTA